MAKAFLPLLIIILCAAAGELRAGESITVSVRIEGFRSNDGICRLLLFNGKKGFPESASDAVLLLNRTIHSKQSEFSFTVQPGVYAVSVFHDENSNKRMDKTWYGKPTEGFGASNNPRVGMGPPGFEETRVHLDRNTRSLVIRLNYL
jgi:uncharacterized protein (DUF2141 family)